MPCDNQPVVGESSTESSTQENETLPGNEELERSVALSLVEQREVLSKIYTEAQLNSKEGDRVFIIPSAWFNKFWDENIVSTSDIGPIDTASICIDFDNFILENYSKHPYLSVPGAVFEKLLAWYGLAPQSKTIESVLIRDENNQLTTEYNRCQFRVHLLKNGSDDENRYYTDGKKPLYFTMSRLSSIKMVMRRCLEVFDAYESTFDLEQHKFRIWHVKDRDSAIDKSPLSTRYRLSPIIFAEFPIKNRLRPNIFDCLIKDMRSPIVDLVIEFKGVEKDQHWLSNYYYYNKLSPPSGIVGLSNLGNSCYMNSALQCLVHIPELRDYFLYGGFEQDINTSNPLGYQGQIAQAFAALVKSLFDDKASALQAFSPRAFKSIIGHHNGMFAGFLQQDSQELLAFLLDGLHEDLNRIMKKPFVEKPELASSDDVNDIDVIRNLASLTWEKHKLRNDSVIVDLFVGLYKSTLTCPACDRVSVTFDPFSDLTLPLPVESFWSAKVRIFPQSSPPCILDVELPKGSTYTDLKNYVAKTANMSADDLIGTEIFNHTFYNNYESENSDSRYLPVDELISETDQVVFYEVPRGKNDLLVPVLNTKYEEGMRNATLFGFPFFIALSEDDLRCYGAIRKQLEKSYVHLSGGFVDFPLVSREAEPELDSFALLKEKHQNADLSEYQTDVKNSNPEVPNEQFFSIKVLECGAGGSHLQKNVSDEHTVWTPDYRTPLNTAFNLMTRLHPISQDIYAYHDLNSTPRSEDLDDLNPPSEETVQETSAAEGSEKSREGSVSDMDVDIDNTVDSVALPEHEDAIPLDQTNHSGDSGHSIIRISEAIICEWIEESASVVFSDEREISWSKPAKLRNMALEEAQKHRSEQEKGHISLTDCLELFSKPEVLGAADSWYCPNCKEHRQATKQIQLWNTPDILTIHLKRFENRHSFSDKISDVVDFPITGLDMSEHLVCHDPNQNSMYDLIAVDNHYGGLGGGHYTAYVKNFMDGKWYYFDDSRVSETEAERAISGAAYLLFYRRRIEGEDVGTPELKKLLVSSRQQHQLRIKDFNEAQNEFFKENCSDSEEDCTLENWHEKVKQTTSDASIYNVASLEVGSSPADVDSEENASRRKLRLLHKNYISALPSPYNLNSSTSGSETSDCSDSVMSNKVSSGAPSSPIL